MLKKPISLLLVISLFLIVVSGCNNHVNETKSNNMLDETIDNTIINFEPEKYKTEEIVFYNLFTPVELDFLIDKKKSYYKSTLLNPLYNITNYVETSDAALNLGVYGADLSYLWMFNQSQQAYSYLSAIQRLADQLQIPKELVDFSKQLSETNPQNYDSLVYIASKSFTEVDKYLKQFNQPHLASLVLLGGYIEAMNIAINLNHELDQNMVSRLATQKFSINSLYNLLMNHQDNLAVSEYLILLRKLKKAYDSYDIQFPQGSLVVDTTKHQIKWKNGHQISLSPQQVLEIRMLTNQLRNHIIEKM